MATATRTTRDPELQSLPRITRPTGAGRVRAGVLTELVRVVAVGLVTEAVYGDVSLGQILVFVVLVRVNKVFALPFPLPREVVHRTTSFVHLVLFHAVSAHWHDVRTVGF